MKFDLRFFTVSCLAGASIFLAPAAFAHTFGAHGAGFVDGLAHPFLGLDHLLAMLAVGLWASQLGGSAMWRVPLAFVAAMAGGAMLAAPAMESSWLETTIAGSVLALGLLIAFSLRLPSLSSLLVISFFAIFHGFAHGQEMPQAASPWSYGMGFLLATASLHLIGVILGLNLGRAGLLMRSGGVAIAAAGLLILAV